MPLIHIVMTASINALGYFWQGCVYHSCNNPIRNCQRSLKKSRVESISIICAWEKCRAFFIQPNMSILHHFPTSFLKAQQIDSWIGFIISNDCCSTANPQLWQQRSPFVTSHEKNISDLILIRTAASINTSKLLHLGILYNLAHLTEERTCNLPIMSETTVCWNSLAILVGFKGYSSYSE